MECKQEISRRQEEEDREEEGSVPSSSQQSERGVINLLYRVALINILKNVILFKYCSRYGRNQPTLSRVFSGF